MMILKKTLIATIILALADSSTAAEIAFRSFEQCLPSQQKCITLIFEGPIEDGDSNKLQNWILNPPDGAREFADLIGQSEISVGWVFFDSRGGDLFEAIKVGDILRKHQVTTQVARDSICYSACVIAILGGVSRISVGEIGIHSFYSEEFLGSGRFEEASDWYNKVSADVESYLRRMRVPVKLLDLMKATAHTSLRILDNDEKHELQIFGFDPVWLQTNEPN